MPLSMMMANKLVCLTYSALSMLAVLTPLPFELVQITTAKAHLRLFLHPPKVSVFCFG